MPKADSRPAALITGGASGIGLAIATLYAQRGYRVAIADINTDKGQIAASELERLGPAIFIPADVSHAGEARDAVVESVKKFGKLAVVINNAGILEPEGFILNTEAELERVIAVNLCGPVWICKHSIAHMKQHGGGSIVNISSIAAFVGGTEHPTYSASKAGLIGLTKALARKYGRNNIRINCICPGSVRDTNILVRSRGTALTNQEKLELTSAIPLGRISTPQDIAEVVFFLTSPAAQTMTGAVIVADGGEMLGR
jgi:NAD(P)-dependent dehydrogenase (short-subunit alcohol dehydrogenase family)